MFATSQISCGSGGGGDDGDGNNESSEEDKAGKVELGPVKGASVAIQALDGFTLYTAITDNNGKFSTDTDKLKSAIDSYSSDLKFVKIVSTGGIDTDPDDDGKIIESEQKEVKGNVSGIVPINTIYSVNEYRINLISTAIMKILDGKQDVSEEQVGYIAERLGVPDVNSDGKIDINDVILYSMKDNDSIAESSLRDGFLEYVYNGDDEAQKLYAQNLKYEAGFAKPLVTRHDGYYIVNLSKTDKNNKIYYWVIVDHNRPGFEVYSGEELVLNYNTAIFYQECSETHGCYGLQKIFFYANSYYLDYDFERIEVNYVEVEKVANNLKIARENLEQTQSERENTESEITKINDEISVLDDKVNSI